MTKEQVRERIQQVGVIPAVRVGTAAEARFAVGAIAAGGIGVVEVTLTIPGAVDVIREFVVAAPQMIVGAGTVLSVEMANRCIDAGAHYITSPGTKLDVLRTVRERDVVSIPGALTPTEVLAAWEGGADFVKIFPCSLVGGPSYIRALKHPFPDVRMIAAGGINLQNAAEYIHAGAAAIGIGTSLISPETVSHHESKRIHELARRYLAIVEKTRNPEDQIR